MSDFLCDFCFERWLKNKEKKGDLKIKASHETKKKELSKFLSLRNTRFSFCSNMECFMLMELLWRMIVERPTFQNPISLSPFFSATLLLVNSINSCYMFPDPSYTINQGTCKCKFALCICTVLEWFAGKMSFVSKKKNYFILFTFWCMLCYVWPDMKLTNECKFFTNCFVFFWLLLSCDRNGNGVREHMT